MSGALPSDRAFAASPSSPSVSPVPASIPSAVLNAAKMLQAREAELAALIGPLADELAAVRQALAAMLGHAPVARRRYRTSGRSIQDAIKSALARGPSTAGPTFQNLVCSIYGRQIDRTSIAPQLSRLRRLNEVAYDKGVWSLASGIEARSDETPKAAQPEGQEPGAEGGRQTSPTAPPGNQASGIALSKEDKERGRIAE